MANKDIDFRFKLHPLTGDLVVKEDEESIRQAMKCIILSTVNDRPLNVNQMGVGVNNLLFENFDPFRVNWLNEKIRINLETFEPRVNLLDVSVNQTNTTLDVAISYSLRRGGIKSEYNLTLERVQ